MGNYTSKFSYVLESLGLKQKEFRIILFGLDAAGKTTLLYKQKLGEVVTTIPTIGFNVETIKVKNVNLTVWDVGLRSKGRVLIRHYLYNTSALVYMIDSNDRERLDEAKEELFGLMQLDQLKDSVLLVIANKQDLVNAMSVGEIWHKLELNKMSNLKAVNIIGTVATKGIGLDECFDWIQSALISNAFKQPLKETIKDVKSLVDYENRLKNNYLNLIVNKFWTILGFSSNEATIKVDDNNII